MASFIAKQLVGKQLDSVKGAMGDKKEEGGAAAEGGATRDPELEQALREAEEKRQEKHRKMEEEREGMRQGIRDKYGIKKKEEEVDFAAMNAGSEGRLGRQRKTPDQIAAERKAEEDEEDSIINMLPENVRGVAKQVVETPQRLVTEAQEKCSLM
jgi:complexin-1/2